MIRKAVGNQKRRGVEYIHECEKNESARNAPGAFGASITDIIFAKGDWWAENGEYGTEIWFCPFCGEKLSVQGEDNA